MTRATEQSSLQSLTLELEARGMTTSAAEKLSVDFVLYHPFAQRLGMRRLVREMESRGLGRESAEGTAGLLIGIELLDRGSDFARVIGQLQGLGLEHSESLANALSSARVYREICARTDIRSRSSDRALRAVACLGLAAFALSIGARLAG